MTGTALDLTPFGGVVKALGWLYWALGLAILLLAFRLPKTGRGKLALTAVVAGAVLYPFWLRPVVKARESNAEYSRRLATASAHFEMRCKSAGETIKRKVENVDGVVWMKWRKEGTAADDYDQFELNDPYGRDCRGEGCIEELLRLAPQGGRFEEEIARRKGRFRFVESIDPRDGQMRRYVGSMRPVPSWTPEAIEIHRRQTGKDIEDYSYGFNLKATSIDHFTARYGITWDDISTREDREHWIAGGSLRVIDLQTNEVIAERVGYMMDRGLGDLGGFRTAWAYAMRDACPAFPTDGTHVTRRWPQTDTVVFAIKVLNPEGAN